MTTFAHQPLLVEHTGSQGDEDENGADEQETEAPQDAVEGFIPFRYSDLRERILHDFSGLFPDADAEARFRLFCDRLSLRNKLRLQAAFKEWFEAYSAVDPDTDRHRALRGLDGAHSPQWHLDSFRSTLQEVLDKGGFQQISPFHIQEARRLRKAMGLSQARPSPARESCCFWFRGIASREVQAPGIINILRVLLCLKPRVLQVKVYQRLIILFTLALPPPDGEGTSIFGARSRHEGKSEAAHHQSPRRLLLRVAAPTDVEAQHGSDSEVDEAGPAPQWYLRMFKDVGQPDLEMLVPGGMIGLSWFDWLYVCGPIAFSFCYTIYIAFFKSKFDTVMDILYSIGLVLVPFSYGIKTRFAVLQKQAQYRAHLNELLLLHSLSCNRGVMSHLLDEAAEQEDNEAMLAYVFLLQQSRTSAELDAAVEAYVSSISRSQHSHFDFEVSDAMAKLEELGLIAKGTATRPGASQVGHVEAEAEGLLQVLPLTDATNVLDVSNYKSGRHGPAPSTSSVLWRYLYGKNG
eukprot:jgi/Botrbrau1/3102/Bobra.0070s0086.1